MRRMSLRKAAALVVVAAPFLGCPGGVPSGVCPCTPCVFAVELSVFDAETEAPLNDFDVAVSVNGGEPARPPECEPGTREGNTCAFGLESGVYSMVVTAPGHAPREAVVRLSDESASDCCNGACKSAKETDVLLDPVASP